VPAEVYHALATVEGLKKNRSDARESSRVQPVPDATIQATLHHLPSVVADMVRFQRLTGCRPGEVCALRPIDVDRSADVWVYRPATHKTQHHGKNRLVFIGPKAQEILRPYLLRESEHYCFSPRDTQRKLLEDRRANRKTRLSCGNKPGSNRVRRPRRSPQERYTNDSYRRAVHRAATKAKIDRWSPNQLRHSAGTDIRRQFGLEAAQVFLGHASADITQVYAERDLELGMRVAKNLG
jgi:integrase